VDAPGETTHLAKVRAEYSRASIVHNLGVNKVQSPQQPRSKELFKHKDSGEIQGHHKQGKAYEFSFRILAFIAQPPLNSNQAREYHYATRLGCSTNCDWVSSTWLACPNDSYLRRLPFTGIWLYCHIHP
jgi:hypothetical protein